HVERGFERGARGRGQRHPVLGEEGARGIRIGGGGSVRRKGPVRRGSGQQRGEQEGVEHAAGGTSRGRGASSATLRADHVSRPPSTSTSGWPRRAGGDRPRSAHQSARGSPAPARGSASPAGRGRAA